MRAHRELCVTVFGMIAGCGSGDSMEGFDPAMNAWHETTPLPIAGGEENRAAVTGNKLYVHGSNGPEVNSAVVP